jgi:hypothetical protein
MQLTTQPVNEQAQSCNHCGSTNLLTRKKSIHVELYCGDYQRWIRWIPKSQAASYLTKPMIEDSPTLKLVRDQAATSRNHSAHVACSERFERIERELTVLVRAVLACGVLQGKGGASVCDVDDGDVDRLAESLAQEEAER